MSAMLMPCGGSVLSDGTTLVGRVAKSESLGLWQRTQYCGSLRSTLCTCRYAWHSLQVALVTTVRRGCTADPSTEKYATWFGVPLATVIWVVVPGKIISVRSDSTPIA